MICTHPMEHWSVLSTEMVTTERGFGSQAVPSVWRCTLCDFIMRRIESCPTCGTPMIVYGYNGMYATRFRCPKSGRFYDRKDLQPIEQSLYERAVTWVRKLRKKV